MNVVAFRISVSLSVDMRQASNALTVYKGRGQTVAMSSFANALPICKASDALGWNPVDDSDLS